MELFPDTIPDTTPPNIMLYTDGGCRGNPGPGAWAALSFIAEDQVQEIFGSAQQTTNNQMELTAVIEALKALSHFYPQYFTEKNQWLHVSVYTDSQYVKNGITTWIHNWKKNSWRTSNKKPVKNQELWQELDSQTQNLAQYGKLKWHWVKGHAGNIYNERCDELVRQNFPT